MRKLVPIVIVALLAAAPAASAMAGSTPTSSIGNPALQAQLLASCPGASSTPMAAFLAGTVSLKRGSSGGAVYELQAFLKLKGYSVGTIDGAFGPLTKEAVKAFQHDQGLTSDGVAGTATRGAIRTLTQKAGFASLANSAGKVLRPSASGAEVKELQRWLKAAGQSPGSIDGAFGTLTTAAVRAFQQSKSLTVDGKVGSATRVALAKALHLMWPGTCS